MTSWKSADNDKTLQAFLSNGYIRSYYKKIAEDCPSLDTSTSAKIAEYWISQADNARGFSVLVLAYLITWAWAAGQSKIPYLGVIGPTGFVAIEIFFLVYVFYLHTDREGLAASRLFEAVADLERNPSCWENPAFRSSIVGSLEKAAKEIERIPLTFRSAAPSVRRQAIVTAKTKAQAIRQLQLWALLPGPMTFTDLIHKLSIDLRTVSVGRWYDLPEVDQLERETSRWLIRIAITGSILLTGGGVVMIVFSQKITAAPVFATLLFTAALALLKSVGLTTEIIERSVETAKEISPKG